MDDRFITVTNKAVYPKQCGPYRFMPEVPQQVPLSFLEQFGYDRSLHFDFAGFEDLLRSHSSDGRPSFDFWCPLSAVDGYGRHALDIFKGLLAIGVDITLRDVEWVDPIHLDGMLRGMAASGHGKLPKRVGVVMSVPYDHHIWSHQSLTRVVITQFETDTFPQRHVQWVNMCHHLIVTSHFQPPVMRRCGVTIPIDVLTPGIDTRVFKFQERKPDGKFKVLMLGALTGRKNPLGAIRIFQEASNGRMDWKLTIKTRNAAGIAEVRRVAGQDPRIEMFVNDTPPHALPQIYALHDCLLWPSKGEGVGLPPLEAMATGMELVCSDNSGMSDYLSPGWAYPIRMSGMEPADLPNIGFSERYVREFGSVGKWWLPDHNHAVKQLRRCFDNWCEGKGKGRLAAEYVAKHHNLDVQARSVLKIVEQYL